MYIIFNGPIQKYFNSHPSLVYAVTFGFDVLYDDGLYKTCSTIFPYKYLLEHIQIHICIYQRRDTINSAVHCQLLIVIRMHIFDWSRVVTL